MLQSVLTIALMNEGDSSSHKKYYYFVSAAFQRSQKKLLLAELGTCVLLISHKILSRKCKLYIPSRNINTAMLYLLRYSLRQFNKMEHKILNGL